MDYTKSEINSCKTLKKRNFILAAVSCTLFFILFFLTILVIFKKWPFDKANGCSPLIALLGIIIAIVNVILSVIIFAYSLSSVNDTCYDINYQNENDAYNATTSKCSFIAILFSALIIVNTFSVNVNCNHNVLLLLIGISLFFNLLITISTGLSKKMYLPS